MELHQSILALVKDQSSWPVEVIPQLEAGIIFSASKAFFRPLYANILNIRGTGCQLPIDIWHLAGEFSNEQISALNKIANTIEATGTPFDGLSGTHEVHGFKAWILSQSRFRKTLMLDVNCFPIQNPEVILSSEDRSIFWVDGPWRLYLAKIAKLRSSLLLRSYPFEFESGQVFVDRSLRCTRNAIRLAAALNGLRGRLYQVTYGDKETYALAFDLLGEPYSIAPVPKEHFFSGAHYAGIIQPWCDGSPLLFHCMARKHEWFRFKREWETYELEANDAFAACS